MSAIKSLNINSNISHYSSFILPIFYSQCVNSYLICLFCCLTEISETKLLLVFDFDIFMKQMKTPFSLLSFDKAKSEQSDEQEWCCSIVQRNIQPIWPCVPTQTHTHPPTHRQMVGEEKCFQLPSVYTSPRMTQHIISTTHTRTCSLPQHMTRKPSGRVKHGGLKTCTTRSRPHTHSQEQALGKCDSLSGCLDLCVSVAEFCLPRGGIDIWGEFLVYVNITALEPN